MLPHSHLNQAYRHVVNYVIGRQHWVMCRGVVEPIEVDGIKFTESGIFVSGGTAAGKHQVFPLEAIHKTRKLALLAAGEWFRAQAATYTAKSEEIGLVLEGREG